jgi:hypothetical protein
MEVVCSRCRSVLASGAGLADAAVLNGSVMGPVGVLVGDPAALTVQVEERGRTMSEVEQGPGHSLWCGLTRQPVDVFAGSDRQSDARTFDVHGFSFLARCP